MAADNGACHYENDHSRRRSTASLDRRRCLNRFSVSWTLDLAATKPSANPVPNLATTAFTREGFVSAKVTGTISGAGNSAVKTGYVEQGLQIGCQIDVSSGLGVGLGFSLGPSVGVSISGVPSANVGVNASVNPSIQTTIAPGTITTIPPGKKDLEAAKASIMAENVHVKVDACMGPVTIRSYAQFAVSTATSDSGSTTRRSEYDGKSCPNTGKSK
ncbi:MspA family porin [Rhodococcus erythropolis]|uniref:MspA family porin n=1 Tax=Rhodococcus erythropolis TaxID=1833 RepID=UPI00366AB8F7